MCCGSRRSAWRFAATVAEAAPDRAPSANGRVDSDPTPAAPRADLPEQPPFQAVTLHYRKTTAIRVRGPITGRAYDFSGVQPVQAVDVRDAAVLGRSSLFDRSAV